MNIFDNIYDKLSRHDGGPRIFFLFKFQLHLVTFVFIRYKLSIRDDRKIAKAIIALDTRPANVVEAAILIMRAET